MEDKLVLTHGNILSATRELLLDLQNRGMYRHNEGRKVYGVPRGGIPCAHILAEMSRGRLSVTYDPAEADLFIDDLVDSGATRNRYKAKYPNTSFFALYNKQTQGWLENKWLVFPWEINEGQDTSANDIVTRLLQHIGEDPGREGLRETPARFLKGWSEWASGYRQDPAEIFKTFEDGANGYDELIVVHNIPVVSKCEHHLADIIGHAHVGYIPNGKIVGLSKLARLTDMFARRLQVQERMTVQIADTLVKHLEPKGVGVIVRASHACMSTRGVKIHNSVTTTSAMRGALMTKPEARKEFLDLCTLAEKSL